MTSLVQELNNIERSLLLRGSSYTYSYTDQRIKNKRVRSLLHGLFNFLEFGDKSYTILMTVVIENI